MKNVTNANKGDSLTSMNNVRVGASLLLLCSVLDLLFGPVATALQVPGAHSGDSALGEFGAIMAGECVKELECDISRGNAGPNVWLLLE